MHCMAKNKWTPDNHILMSSLPKTGSIERCTGLVCITVSLHWKSANMFQHDNAPVHKARLRKTWFAKIGVKVLKCLDLNPAEHLWDLN